MDVDKTIPLYVFKHCVGLYNVADQWKDFTIIVGLDDSVEAIDAQPASRVRKFLQDGHLLLETPDGTRYDATGRKVE